jgi:undecaprenyl-diphosphatase
LVALAANLPRGVASALVGLVQTIALVLPLLVAVPVVVARRFRLLALLGGAVALGAVGMAIANGVLDDVVPRQSLRRQTVESWWTGAAFPSTAYLAAVVALVVAGARFVSSGWRKVAWAGIAAAVVSRLLTATEIPLSSGVALAVGTCAGSVALLVLGAPPRRLDVEAIATALDRAGLSAQLEEPPRRRADGIFFRATTGVGPAYVRVFGRDERDAAMLLRAWNALWVKGIGDARPRASPRRIVEHDVLALALAATAGARAPRPLALATTDDGAGVVAEEWVDGRSLESAGPDAIDDELLHELWRNVAALHERRIAHRTLRVDHVMVDGASSRDGRDGRVVLVDFDRSNTQADDELLAVDVAELLCSLGALLGAARAVGTAAAVLPPDALARTLPVLQPLALTPPTRELCKSDKALLPAVRAGVEAATGAEPTKTVDLQRISIKGLLTLVGTIVLGSFVIGIVSNWSDIWSSLRDTEPAAVPVLLVLMVLTYVGGALSMMGAVERSLPFGRTTEVMFGQAFLNRFTPANAGGMAMRVRYLQLQGEDLALATAAIGLTSLASGAVQAVMLVVFALWGRQTAEFSSLSLPDGTVVLLVVIVVAAVIGAVVLSGWGRRVALPWVRTTVGKLRQTVGTLLHRPDKLGLLLGGATLSKLAFLTAFWVSVLALGEDMSFARAGAIYMVANTIGSSVPTPGGVGGLEAALIAMLLTTGMDESTATAIVLLFRLFTFWLPTLPGYVLMRRVTRLGLV